MRSVLLFTLTVLLVNSFYAQVGVLTLKKKDPIYYGQWFTLKDTPNKIYLIDEPEYADLALERLLEPYELNIEEGRDHDNGGLFWVIESDNGFTSTIFRKKNADGEVMLCVATNFASDEDEFTPWYEKVFRTRGYLFSFSK
jgi:hypothetical protein